MSNFKFVDTTEKTIEAAFQVRNIMGYGSLQGIDEAVYSTLSGSSQKSQFKDK